MKKFKLILVALFSIVSAFAVEPANEFCIVSDENFRPFVYRENNEVKGICVEFIREIQQRIGDQTPITLGAWVNMYARAQKLPNTAIFPLTRLPEREATFNFAVLIGDFDYVLVARADRAIKLTKISDAVDWRVVAERASFAANYLVNHEFKNLLLVSEINLGGDFLRQNKADLWLLPAFCYEAIAKTADFKVVLNTGVVRGYLAFNIHTDPQIIKRWQEAAAVVKREGIYERILEKYLTPPANAVDP